VDNKKCSIAMRREIKSWAVSPNRGLKGLMSDGFEKVRHEDAYFEEIQHEKKLEQSINAF